MIVAFSGWRDWTDDLFIHTFIDREWGKHLLFGGDKDELVFRVGDARGADAIIYGHLTVSGAEPMVYVADWDRFGKKAAGPIRNRCMLLGLDERDPHPKQHADILVAFPEPGRIKPANESLEGGTWDAVKQAHFFGVEVRIPPYKLPLIARPEVVDYYQLTIGAQQ